MLSVLNRHSKRKAGAKPLNQLKGLKGKDQTEDLPERMGFVSQCGCPTGTGKSKALADSHSKFAFLGSARGSAPHSPWGFGLFCLASWTIPPTSPDAMDNPTMSRLSFTLGDSISFLGPNHP